MKKSTLILLTLIMLMTAILLTSCGVDYTDEDLSAALEELLPKSYELNVVYFGEGLPKSEDYELVEEFRDAMNIAVDVENMEYYPVSLDCGYINETELREATLEVFSEDYSAFLFERAFTGITTILNEGTENEVKEVASFARYIEEYGMLTVRDGLEKEALPVDRRFDISGMTVQKKRKKYAIVTLPVEGNPSVTEEFRLVPTEAGWRLDGPTY